MYCFSSSSCVNKLSHVHRVKPLLIQIAPEDLMNEKERKEYLLRKNSQPRIIKTFGGSNRDDDQCCPVKTVMGNPGVNLSGLYILRLKLPRKESHCNDNCAYVKVIMNYEL